MSPPLLGLASNPWLPYRFRAACVELLVCMFVDRFPQQGNCGAPHLPEQVMKREFRARVPPSAGDEKRARVPPSEGEMKRTTAITKGWPALLLLPSNRCVRAAMGLGLGLAAGGRHQRGRRAQGQTPHGRSFAEPQSLRHLLFGSVFRGAHHLVLGCAVCGCPGLHDLPQARVK